MKKTILIFLLTNFSFALSLSAKVLISPIEALKENYSLSADVSKKNLLLTKEKFQNIQKSAKVKLDTKIYRIFTAKEHEKVLGFGILINKQVRSKNAVVLYFISKSVLKGIEIIAFNEPQEYIPTKHWNEQFKNIPTDKMLRLSTDIPTITGATLSARSITDGSRVAFAIYNELLKEQ